MTKLVFARTSAVTFVAILLACVPVHADELIGKGEWRSVSGGDAISGTWRVTLTRADTAVTGTMELTGSNVLKKGTVNGTVNGSSVLLGVSSDGATEANFTGKLNGNAISGEWDCPALKDDGVWQGTLIVQR